MQEPNPADAIARLCEIQREQQDQALAAVRKAQDRVAMLIPSSWADAIREDMNRPYPSLLLRLAGPPPPPPTRRVRFRYWLRERRERIGKLIAPTLLTYDEASDRYGD